MLITQPATLIGCFEDCWARATVASTTTNIRQSLRTVASTLFMALGSVAVEAIDHPRFGYAQRQPVLHVPLQLDVELLGQLLRFCGYGFPAGKLHLKRELADQRLVFPARPPERDVAL